MSHSTTSGEKPLISALFQIAANIDDARSLASFKRALSLGYTPVSEQLLDKDKLEGILKGAMKRKKLPAKRSYGKRLMERQLA